jgi:type IV secretory pathway VirB2 component (pilin)
VRNSAAGEFMAAIATMAAVLLGLNSVAGDWHPMLRFALAIVVAVGVVGVVRASKDAVD